MTSVVRTAVCLTIAAGLALAAAQEFVFVSDRVLRSLERIDGSFYSQSDLFLYRNGSEIRLTFTADAAEYDPIPSPDGQFIAYAVTDLVHPVDDDADWQWRLEVIDLLLRRTQASWKMPNSEGITRPAGGFAIAWLEDGRSFLAQVPGEGSQWEVHRFSIGQPESEMVARGFGVVTSPDGAYVATARNGITYAIDLAKGEEVVLAAGDPLGWNGNDTLLIARTDAVTEVDVTSQRADLVADYFGQYYGLRWNPARDLYAYILEQNETWYVTIARADHQEVETYSFTSFVETLDWLSDEHLVLSLERDGASALALLDLFGNDPIIVDSIGSDHSPRALR